MKFARGGVFILLCLISVAALGFTFPWLKEGYGTEEMPLFSGVAAGLALCGLVWWVICGRADSRLFRAGLAVLAFPFLIYTYLTGKIIFNELLGRQMARGMSISGYQERPIQWPGFDGPIGLAIEFDASHSIGRSGNLYSPVIAMEPEMSYEMYFRDYARAQLMTPLMQMKTLPSLSGSPAHLRYELYPSDVKRVSEARICIQEARYAPSGVREHLGSSLSAGWFLAAHGGAIADFSSKLSEAIRQSSAFQGKPDEWRRIFQRVKPDGLARAGYRVCAEQKPGWGEVCYCR